MNFQIGDLVKLNNYAFSHKIFDRSIYFDLVGMIVELAKNDHQRIIYYDVKFPQYPNLLAHTRYNEITLVKKAKYE